MVAGDAVAAYAEPSPDNIFASLINGANSHRGCPVQLPDKLLLSMPPGMKDQLKQLARLKHCSMNDIIRRTLQEALELYDLWPLNGEPPSPRVPVLATHPRSKFTMEQLGGQDSVVETTVNALELTQAVEALGQVPDIRDGSSIAHSPANAIYYLKRKELEDKAKADASFNELLTESQRFIRKFGEDY